MVWYLNIRLKTLYIDLCNWHSVCYSVSFVSVQFGTLHAGSSLTIWDSPGLDSLRCRTTICILGLTPLVGKPCANWERIRVYLIKRSATESSVAMEMQNINIPQVAYNIEQIDKLLGAIHKLASVSNDTVSSVTETLDRVIGEKIQQEIRSKVYLARELIGDVCFDLEIKRY